MTHCNPAPPNPDGVAMALCWPSGQEALVLVAILGILLGGIWATGRYTGSGDAKEGQNAE